MEQKGNQAGKDGSPQARLSATDAALQTKRVCDFVMPFPSPMAVAIGVDRSELAVRLYEIGTMGNGNPTKKQTMKTIIKSLCALACVVTLANAADGERYLLIEDTASPDGRYALAWGMADFTPLDASDPDKLLSNLNLDLVENYLIDLQRKEVIATVGSVYFSGKNHGSLSACWREDSKAVFIVEGGKWAFDMASVLYIVEPKSDYDQCSDAIPVTLALRRAIKAKLLKDHPKEKESINNFAISIYPEKWTDGNSVLLQATGEVPKALDAFGFDGPITVSLPEPALVKITEKPISEKAITENLITSDSAGKIKLGTTVAEARREMTSATFNRSSDGEGIALIDVIQGEEHLMTLYAGEEEAGLPVDGNAVIKSIEVWDSNFMTAEGIHPGMKVSEAEVKYGKIKEITMSEIESREYATFSTKPSGLDFRLIHQNDTAGSYQNGEMVTTRYTPGASIFSIGVSGSHIMEDGSIAGIRIDDTGADVQVAIRENKLGNVLKREDVIWEAFGQAVQEWMFPESGLTLNMISDKIGGPKTVFSIAIEGPSVQKTGKGIGIGSSKADVIKAYAKFKTDTGESAGFFDGQDVHLVGSIYGGMVFFFKDGKLNNIFFGASAE